MSAIRSRNAAELTQDQKSIKSTSVSGTRSTLSTVSSYPYQATLTYTFTSSGGNDGEVQATDNLNMTRVNNNTLSVWTDKCAYMIMPGSQLYNNGYNFKGYVETNNMLIDDQKYMYGSSEDVTSVGPNTTPTNTTTSISLNSDSVGASWQWTTNAVNITNESDTTQAKWNLAFTKGTSTAESTYNATPGWQMTNNIGNFVFTRNITMTWRDYKYYAYPTWTDTAVSTTVSKPDW